MADPKAASLLPAAVQESNEVLEYLKNNGSLDDLRRRLVEELRGQEGLRSCTTSLVEQSPIMARALANPKQYTAPATRRQLVDAVRKDIERKLLDELYGAAWAAMNAGDGRVAPLLVERVHQALCAVHEARFRREHLPGGQAAQQE